MADTIREKILTAIGKKLARVRKSSLYATDCGLNVNREILQVDDEDKMPAYVFKTGDESAESGGSFVTCKMIVGVEGHVLIGKTGDPSKIKEQILGDTIKVMTDRRTIDDTTAGLAESVLYVGSTDASARAADDSIGIQVLFEVKYRYKTGDPFSSLKKKQGETP